METVKQHLLEIFKVTLYLKGCA